MKAYFVLILFLISAIGHAAQRQPLNLQLLENAIISFMDHHEIPGIAVGVFDGEKETILCYGLADIEKSRPVSPETIFELASVTKVFTTTGLGLHLVKGDMALQGSISKYIPGLLPNRPIDNVTIMQLATHTSCLPRVVPKANWHHLGLPKIVHFLNDWHPKYPIGSRYEYSNLGFGLLGYALEDVEKRSYASVIEADVLVPLGMSSTFTEAPEALSYHLSNGYNSNGRIASKRPPKYIPGSGALLSSIKDMMKFLKANMGYDVPPGLYKAMTVSHQPYFKVQDNFIMGLAWQRWQYQGLLIIDKNGGLPGFATYIGWAPDKKLGIVILANKTKARSTSVARFLLKAL